MYNKQCSSCLFHTLQASLGGRVRLIITGAAPVSPTILTFLRAALGCQVSHIHSPISLIGSSLSITFFMNVSNNMLRTQQFYEGYGQTECTAGCSMSMPGDWTAGKNSSILMYYSLWVEFTHFFIWTMKLNCDYFVSAGHVGPPLPCNSIKLVDVAEMNYLAANGEGEVRSPFFLVIKYMQSVRKCIYFQKRNGKICMTNIWLQCSES